MQAPRASRISEAKWNTRRQKIEKLYVDDDLSRQELIKTMAREDNFFVTEKQLKYQFKKWGLKKYVSDHELTAMLSVKRKRQELGKNTGFMYRGHLFEQERLERASKRRKGPLISSPILPSYITALLSPRDSSPMACSRSPRLQTSALSHGIEQAAHDSGMLSSLDFLSNNVFHQPGNSGSSDPFSSLDVFSEAMLSRDGEQTQTSGGLWETLFDNNIPSFSPRLWTSMPTPSGRDIQVTRTSSPSPLMRQVPSNAPGVPVTQSTNDNHFTSPDLNLDLDFSMFLNSPHRPSTAPSSPHSESHLRRSVERMSISPLRLTDQDDNHRENGEYNVVSKFTSAADQALGPVTEEDSTAELIASLLFMLKSLILPRFDTATQKYKYEKSVLSDLFCPHHCERVCFEVEELLDLYVERSLRSIRKRRTARGVNSMQSRRSFSLNGRRQNHEILNSTEQLTKPTEAIDTSKLEGTLFHSCSTPWGHVTFKIRKGPSSSIDEEGIDSACQTIISFMPRAKERTLGICARLSSRMSGPAIGPEIRTFNVVPDDSEIIQCVCNNDVVGIQALLDLGAASARDVDSHGRSLLTYAIFTGCSDVFRLLVQGGASMNACSLGVDQASDIISTFWDKYATLHSETSTTLGLKSFSVEAVRELEQCVAMTRLALEYDCMIDSANHQIRSASPLFSIPIMATDYAHASSMVEAINYLHSIGFNLEEKNSLEQTPLLNAATGCKPQVASCLRALIERGARLDARDEIGRGPLHSALSPPWPLSNWVELTCILTMEENFDNTEVLYYFLETEDRKYARDYYGIESKLGPIRTPSPPYIYPSNSSVDNVENTQLVRDLGVEVATEQPTPIGTSISGSESDASSCAEESITNTKDDDYVHCVDPWGEGAWIRNPIHVLRNRVRTKLRILLEAGCDPNDLDDNGNSPSGYARDGLWPQWLWALETTGYVFDDERDLWIKRIDSA